MYEAPLCGLISGVDRTWLFRSVSEPTWLIIHALQGSGHPHVLVKGLAPFLCYCQRKQMSNSACFCWVLASHPHSSSGWVLVTVCDWQITSLKMGKKIHIEPKQYLYYCHQTAVFLRKCSWMKIVHFFLKHFILQHMKPLVGDDKLIRG